MHHLCSMFVCQQAGEEALQFPRCAHHA
jgi:hypothetical protein